MGAANKFDFLYPVRQRKDVKCFTVSGNSDNISAQVVLLLQELGIRLIVQELGERHEHTHTA
jgi:hypothetical protein